MQQYSRGNNTAQANSLKDLLQNKIDDMEKQVLSRVNTIEETKPTVRNETDQRNRVESTLTTLHHRITDLEKGAFGFSGRTDVLRAYKGFQTLRSSKQDQVSFNGFKTARTCEKSVLQHQSC